MNFDPEYAAQLLGQLPSGTEVEFTLYNGTLAKGEARDYPRPGRRFTVDGWEWFVTAELLADKVIRIRVLPFSVQVINS